MCVSCVAEVATSRKVSRSVSFGRMRDEDVNSLSNIMGSRVSTYRSRLPAESQTRWRNAPFRLFNRAASAAAVGVEVQWYSGEYVCEPRCATVIICLYRRGLYFVLLSDRVSYIVMRGRWCNIFVPNVHSPSEEKSDESKDSFYEELEQVFDHLPKYHMKILLRDFNAKVGRENIFKPTIGKESLQQDSNDNG